ncbi:MAG: hypothetical protein PHX08_00325 [Lachnospiraceae bacterium]|nr:hypothetical protein [Lachnospiraceae bacterium]
MKNNTAVIEKDMEFLLKELHKEWDRSGVTKASVTISIDEADEVNKALLLAIAKRQEQTEKALDFKECIRLSRENYILLRLARKVKKQEDRCNKLAMDMEFEVEMDKEEFKLFKTMFGDKVKTAQ